MTDPDVLLRQHHVGCLFAHLAQWQLAADSGNKHTFIFESDGFLPGLLAVPVAALGDIQHQAPEDYDIVFLHHPGEIVGPKVKEFRTALGDEVELYEYNERNRRRGSPDTSSATASCERCRRWWRREGRTWWTPG